MCELSLLSTNSQLTESLLIKASIVRSEACQRVVLTGKGDPVHPAQTVKANGGAQGETVGLQGE